MGAEALWSIGGADLLDTYKQPNLLDGLVWRAGGRGQRWPLFHPSEADPDSGYRLHPYAILFDVAEPAPAYLLRIAYLAIMPRLAWLDVELNGVSGSAHPVAAAVDLGRDPAPRGTVYTTLYADLARARRSRSRARSSGGIAARTGSVLSRSRRGEVLPRVEHASEAVERARPASANASGILVPSRWRSNVARRGAAGAALASTCCRRCSGAASAAAGRALRAAAGTLGGPLEAGELGCTSTKGGSCSSTRRRRSGTCELGFVLTARRRPRRRGSCRRLGLAGTLRRRRKWRVHVTPHVHTDVGYTHRQWEVAERIARTIDAALEQPPPATYHLDSAFGLETWLQTRSPERIAQLERQGRIAVSGIYVDLLTQYAALEDLVRNAALARRLTEPHGLPADFVSIVDVASLSGSLPALLEGAGLRYLVHASNQDRGPFRVNGGLHRGSPYWWTGPAGGRVLVWLAKMYCELRKVCGSPPVPDAAARGLDLWLAEYERDDYLPDRVLLYGQEADNTDLDPQPAEFVRRWNEQWAYPELVFSDVSSFFREVEGLELPEVRGDGGAYWEDGVGSTMSLTANARQAQADLPAAERLEALAVLHDPGFAFPAAQFDEAWRQLLSWEEHTWGAFLSGPEPDALLQRDLWAVKEQLGREASAWATRLLHVAASRHALQWGTEGREVVVQNPHSWPVSGAVRVEIEPDEVCDVPERPVQELATQRTVELWVDGLPGLSYRRLPLRRGEARARVLEDGTAIESAHYRLELDESGAVASLVDRALDRELVDAAAPWAFGSLLLAHGGEGTRLVSNAADLPPGEPRLEQPFRAERIRVERFAHGSALHVEAGEGTVEWTLPDRDRRVEVSFTWRKPERRDKEAAYVPFPLTLGDAAVLSDSQLGWVEWGADDLPGACKEWLPLQTSVLVRGDGCDVLLCSPDVPLFCVGDVVRGRWPVEQEQRGGRILSYVLNNYWHTNYRASQGGELRFRYRLASAPEIGFAEAHRRGWEARRPLYGQRISYQDFREPRAPYLGLEGTLASVESETVVLSTLKAAADGRGFVARFQETAGRAGEATLRIPGRRIEQAWSTDLLERDRGPLTVDDGALAVDVPAWGLATVRFHTDESAAPRRS